MKKVFSSWIPFSLYMLMVSIVSLWPFNFDFDLNKNHAEWNENGSGLKFPRKGQAISGIPPLHFFENLATGSGLTVEVWIKPYNSFQKGPARILSYSADVSFRNFSLAQSEKNLVMRVRTTRTDLNGMYPHIEAQDIFADSSDLAPEKHIVFTYDCYEARVYVDGKRQPVVGALTGDFRDWDSGHRLVVGNEVTGDRPWLGEIYYAAVYDKALTEEDIGAHFKRGLQVHTSIGGDLKYAEPLPLVCYTFDKKTGALIPDKANATDPIHLHIPEALPPFPFDLQGKTIWREFLPINLIFNVGVFIPFGFMLLGYTQKKFTVDRGNILGVFLIGFVFSFGIEYLQHYLPAKHSSVPELTMKFAGFFLGMTIWRLSDGEF